MIVPEYISRDGITAHCLSHAYPLPPVFAGYAGRMHFAADDAEWFAVQQEFVLPQCKRVRGLRMYCVGNSKNEQATKEDPHVVIVFIAAYRDRAP
jgi:hypothetical protein